MLKHLTAVVIRFVPSDPKSTSARELLQRLASDKARRSNPSCVVDFKVEAQAWPDVAQVQLHFTDGEKRTVQTCDKKVDDIVKLIHQKASEMELRDVMKEVSYNPWQRGL